MSSERFSYILLAVLGVSLVINLYVPVYPPGNGYFWSGIIQGILLGILASLIAGGLFLAAWRKGLTPGHTLWQSMSLSQKSLLGFCAVGLIRGAMPLLWIPIPTAGWIFPIILILQIAGSAALVLMIAPVMVRVYRGYFASLSARPLRVRLEAVCQAALIPVSAASVIILLVSFFTLGSQPNPALGLAQRISLLVVALLILVISLLRLPERKARWVIFAVGAALAAVYSLYWLMS